MLLKAPDRSRRLLGKPPARPHKPRPLPSNRRAVQRISQQRSKRSPRSPKQFSVAMADKRQAARKKIDLASVAAKEGIASENLLIFLLAGELFGLRLATVAEIIRLPHLAHMPLVPPSLHGLANLRGSVLPVVSLRALLHLPDVEANEQTRVIVMRGAVPVGFVVDRVDRLMTLAVDQFEQDATEAGTIDSALFDGVIKGAEGKSTIKLLNPSGLLSGQFVQLGVAATRDAIGTSVAITTTPA